MIKIKRIYEPAEKNDGYRILADRLWPRGLSKKEAKLDLWLKDIAPSNELRKWYSHDPRKWPEFKKRYSKELKDKKNQIKLIPKSKNVTLLYGAKDEEHNNAVVLKEFLESGK